MSHTPGPWSIDPNGPMYSVNSDITQRHVAMVSCYAEKLANANLIAAAPDLLAALERAEAKLREYSALCGHGVLTECIDARAAIAKANGE